MVYSRVRSLIIKYELERDKALVLDREEFYRLYGELLAGLREVEMLIFYEGDDYGKWA